jgi:hypothetical protein
VKIIPEWTDLDNEVKRVEKEAAASQSSNLPDDRVKEILEKAGKDIIS